MLDAFAHLLRGVMHRAGALQHVLATSAFVDDDAAQMLEVTRRQRHTRQSRIVRALARRKMLRTGLTQPKATDIVYTVMSPEVFRILTVERGWSEDEYEAWLARTLRTQLLPPAPVGMRAGSAPSPLRLRTSSLEREENLSARVEELRIRDTSRYRRTSGLSSLHD
ncbi:hypothetical protein [Rhodococcus sp. ACPA1]|uniref:hypothetical protein n=1 Tax=Rhodococcus sp. ACPA1 TaxID=2028572 RepID=UPI001C530CE1|nr:hypothetical protein [Rhodococcus sp. ACPA1]